MTFTRRDFDRLVGKFEMQTRTTHHLIAWMVVDGRKVARTRRSHGRGDPPEHHVRNQLHLDADQLAEAVDCTLGRDDYIALLREKGIL